MFPVPVEGPGRLWIMPCPDGANLRDEIAHYKSAGATHVVSMLAVDEAVQLGLDDEGAMCAEAGITFLSHPIADFGLPDPNGFADLVRQIADWVAQGQGVAVHCRAGIGRSGMVSAGVLIELGQSAQAAIDNVSKARGVSIPDTVEQGTFLTRFADEVL